MTDAAFLAALAQTPHDADLRAVYADFLDDAGRGDEAELLRAEEAMRRLPVWSDEYWALKARRNELRRVCPEDWQRATRCDGSRPESVFRDGYPSKLRDRWRLVRAFAEVWHGVELPDVGGHAEGISVEQSRSGVTFGVAVRELAALGLDLSNGSAGRPGLGEMIRFDRLAENVILVAWYHGVVPLTVALANVSEDDPPVDRHEYEWDERTDEGTLIEGDRGVYASVTEMAVSLVAEFIPSRFDFSVPTSILSEYLGADSVGIPPDVPIVYWDEVGVSAMWADRRMPAPPGNTFIRLHHAVAFRDIPIALWKLSRHTTSPTVFIWRSDAEFAEAEAFFADNPPQWFAVEQRRRRADGSVNNNEDDIPF